MEMCFRLLQGEDGSTLLRYFPECREQHEDGQALGPFAVPNQRDLGSGRGPELDLRSREHIEHSAWNRLDRNRLAGSQRYDGLHAAESGSHLLKTYV